MIRYHPRHPDDIWRFRLSIAPSTAARLFVRTADGDVVLNVRGVTRPIKLSGSFALVDPEAILLRAGNHYIRAGEGDPVVLSVSSHRLVIR
jgi:hypothetical protein